MSNSELKVLAVLIALAGVTIAVWYFQDDILPPAPTPVVTPPAPAVEQTPEPSQPLHPVAPIPEQETIESEPLPPLDESDPAILAALVETLGAEIDSLLANEGLVDRFVATVDNLPRRHVPEKIRPVGRLASQFVAAGSADDRYFVLGPENFQRYDAVVALFTTVDMDSAIDLYRRYYPLLQSSYERLGYPDAYFNDRVVEVIDHLLQLPQPPQALQLVRPHVLYEFADPELEVLSSGHKIMLRIGPDNSARVSEFLRTLRARIVVEQPARL